VVQRSRFSPWRVAISVKAFESEQDKAKRAELRTQRELRALADKVSAYGRAVHKQFPSGEVVISERDLAEQLRKRTDMIVSALNLLLRELQSAANSPERVLEAECLNYTTALSAVLRSCCLP
jgi:hypothetical protein